MKTKAQKRTKGKATALARVEESPDYMIAADLLDPLFVNQIRTSEAIQNRPVGTRARIRGGGQSMKKKTRKSKAGTLMLGLTPEQLRWPTGKLIETFRGCVDMLSHLLTRKNDPKALRYATDAIGDLLHTMLFDCSWHNPIIGGAAYRIARDYSGGMMGLIKSKNPPGWMKEIAPNEYAVPWIIVNGKPAPGLEALHGWGRAVAKRGKSRFDVPQTSQTAWALYLLNMMRNAPARCHFVSDDGENFYTIPRGLRKLPPFSRSTVAKWWPFVRSLIRRTRVLWLRPKQREAIRRATAYGTDAEAENEYMKRVKVALVGLAPD